MKYFNPSYWFKLWLLSAPLFNDKTQGINAKSIDNKKIKDWASINTTDISLIENQELSLANNQTTLLDLPLWNSNLTQHTENHKHRHQKSRNRYKRRPIPPSKEIFQLSEKLIINQNNPNQYRNSFQSILESLTNNNILRIIFDDSENRNWGENSRIFSLNSQNYGYFRLPVQIIQEQNGQSNQINLELVLSTDALYIQGFIINHHDTSAHTSNIETYYYFNPDLGTPSGRYNPQLREVTGITNSIMLSQIGNAYRHLIPTENNNINWETIYNSFLRLTNDINVNIERPLGNLARALGQVIFVTAEAIRFPNIYARIVSHLITRNENINLESNQRNEIYTILVNWGTNSRDSIFRWLLQIANTIQNTPNMMISPPSIVDFTRELNSPAVQVVLGYIEFQRIRNIGRNANCRRGKRELKNTYWHEKFCDLKPQIDKIKGKITAIKVLDENTKVRNLKAGDIYLGTTEGVYLIHGKDFVFKANNIDDEINSISILKGNKIFVTTKKEEIFYINTDHINILYPDSVYAEGLFDSKVKSSNLEKEIKLYYLKSNNNWNMNFKPDVSTQNNYYKIDWNLKKINPVDNYEKLEFLGDVYSNGWGVKTQWGSWIYDGNPANHKPENTYDLDYFMKSRNNKFHKIIENTKSDDYSIDNSLQKFDDNYLSAKIAVHQRFGLTWYWEDDNYYLKIGASQYCNWWASESSLECSVKLGNGIRLYNDDTFETQISNPNDRKRREIFEEKNELKNITKWTDEFTKSINNEQHLPINNKTNFATNNITSL